MSSQRQAKRNRFRQRQQAQQVQRQEAQRQAFAALTAPLAPARILYVALDIGKNVHWLRADTGAGQVVQAAQPLVTTQAGYATCAQLLQQWLTQGAFDLIVLGHEPTGIYHEAWGYHLQQDFAAYLPATAHPRWLYQWVNPYQVKLARQQATLRPHKTDPLDLLAISQVLRQGYGQPVPTLDPATARLHQQVFLAHQAARQLKATHLQILRQVDRLWPGALVKTGPFARTHPDLPAPTPLIGTRPLERTTFRVLLEHCPNPYTVRELGPTGLITLFHQHGARCGPVTAQRIYDNAVQALLPGPDHLAVYLEVLQALLADEAHWQERRATAEATLVALTTETPARHLLALPGLTARQAAYYFSLIGAPPRFTCASQVWAYVGFDPIRQASGDSAHTYTLSRRGDACYRHLLTWMAVLVASHHPTFGLCWQAAETRGLGYWGAAIHTAHKLNRLCFALITEDRPWVDATPPEDLPRWHTYWVAYHQQRQNPHRPDPGVWTPSQPPGVNARA